MRSGLLERDPQAGHALRRRLRGLRSLRVGTYRIIYQLADDERTVRVAAIQSLNRVPIRPAMMGRPSTLCRTRLGGSTSLVAKSHLASSLEPRAAVWSPTASSGARRPISGALAGGWDESLGVQLLLKKCEHCLLERAGLLVGSAWVRKVVLLDRIDGEVVELVLLGFRLGDGGRRAAVETFVPLARNCPELLIVVVTGELDHVCLAVDIDLGDHGLQVVRLLHRRVNTGEASDLLNGLFVGMLPSLISSSVVNSTGCEGVAGSAERIAADRSLPGSGRAST